MATALKKVNRDERIRRLKSLKAHLSLTQLGMICDHLEISQSTVYNYLDLKGNDYCREMAIIVTGEQIIGE